MLLEEIKAIPTPILTTAETPPLASSFSSLKQMVNNILKVYRYTTYGFLILKEIESIATPILTTAEAPPLARSLSGLSFKP